MIRFVAIQLALKTTSFILQSKKKTVKHIRETSKCMRLINESYLLINGINNVKNTRYSKIIIYLIYRNDNQIIINRVHVQL